jgi:nucleotide-binding universal stress UspA family protein
MSERLMKLAGDGVSKVEITPSVIHHGNIAKAIITEALHYDLVVARTRRRRTSSGGLEIGAIPSRLVQQLKCSLILFGEPHS